MSKRLNTDEAFQSIIGKNNIIQEKNKIAGGGPAKEKLLQTAFYITEKQRAALKMKTALSGKPEDKDQSSIVRAALDAYLADIIDTL
jgi:hypothetical protein